MHRRRHASRWVRSGADVVGPACRSRGTGMVATTAGVAVFIGFLLLAVQVLLGLYATTVLSAAAFDATRHVATAGGDERAVGTAEQRLRAVLGRAYDDIELRWDLSDQSVVRLTVVAAGPQLLPDALDGPLPFDRVARTFTVRTERVR